MPEQDEMQRFDALLEAMTSKPPLQVDVSREREEDLRETTDEES